MYRRIELIKDEGPWYGDYDDPDHKPMKHGIMGATSLEVVDAWIYELRGPDKGIPFNARFYFTEKGWNEVGRKVIEACQKTGQKYRIIKVKENAVNVVWRDKYTGYEVAAQPKKDKK